MPKKLPEDLYSGPVKESAMWYLQKFKDGEVSRTDALEQAMKDIRGKLISALNTIASKVTGDANTEQLPRKKIGGHKFWAPAMGEQE